MPLSLDPPRQASAQRQVAWTEKIGLGLGRVVTEGSHGTIHVLINPIFNMTLGMNPALISTIVFIQRIWDAVLDPLVGHYSDNFRSRWGRRRPLLVLSALPVAVSFAAIWMVPAGLSHSGLFLHLLVCSLLFYAAHTFFSMPLAGLTLEATDDYHERSRVAAVVFACAFCFLISSQWLFHLVQLPAFSSRMEGLRWVAGGCAVLFFVAALAPALLCRERHYDRVAQRQPRVSLLASLRLVRGNRPFLLLVTTRFISSFGYNVVGILAFYMNYYYVYRGDLKSAAFAYGFLGSTFMIASIASTFVYPRLAQRWGKKRVMQIAAGILMAGSVCKLFVYHPEHPWLQAIVLMSNGAASAGLGLMSMSMLGDIADLDELNHGGRREGLFASLHSWAEKAGNSFGTMLSGFVLVWIGFDATRGAQSEATLQWMKLSYFLTPFTGAAVALAVIHRYDLDESRANQIRERLVQQRLNRAPVTPHTADRTEAGAGDLTARAW